MVTLWHRVPCGGTDLLFIHWHVGNGSLLLSSCKQPGDWPLGHVLDAHSLLLLHLAPSVGDGAGAWEVVVEARDVYAASSTDHQLSASLYTLVARAPAGSTVGYVSPITVIVTASDSVLVVVLVLVVAVPQLVVTHFVVEQVPVMVVVSATVLEHSTPHCVTFLLASQPQSLPSQSLGPSLGQSDPLHPPPP